MNRAEHYREAERLLASQGSETGTTANDLFSALVHALLANVAAAPVPGPQVGSVGARVRGLRSVAGLSQTQVSQQMSEAGFSNWYQVTVGRVEAGSRPLRFDEALAVAEILGVTVTALSESGDQS